MVTGIKHIVHPVEAAAVMELLSSRPRLLVLGEPTHGAERLLEVRNGLFRQLVEQEGYRTMAIESDCLDARRMAAVLAEAASPARVSPGSVTPRSIRPASRRRRDRVRQGRLAGPGSPGRRRRLTRTDPRGRCPLRAGGTHCG